MKDFTIHKFEGEDTVFFGGGSKRCENFLGELYHHSIGISKIRRKHKKEAKFESIFKIKTSSKHEFVSF